MLQGIGMVRVGTIRIRICLKPIVFFVSFKCPLHTLYGIPAKIIYDDTSPKAIHGVGAT